MMSPREKQRMRRRRVISEDISEREMQRRRDISEREMQREIFGDISEESIEAMELERKLREGVQFLFKCLYLLTLLGCLDMATGKGTSALKRLTCDLRIAFLIVLLSCNDIENNPGPDGQLNANGGVIKCVLVLILALHVISLRNGNHQDDVIFHAGDTANINFVTKLPRGIEHVEYVIYKDPPFAQLATEDGLHSEGLTENQIARFSVSSSISDHVLTINITVTGIAIEDKGMYMLIIQSIENDNSPRILRKNVSIVIPPGEAVCYITDSDIPSSKNVHCNATSGNMKATLACFQENQMVHYNGPVKNDGVGLTGVFWIDPAYPISCCSHPLEQAVTQVTCTDYMWAPETSQDSSPTTDHVTEITLPTTDSASHSMHTCYALIFLTITMTINVITL